MRNEQAPSTTLVEESSAASSTGSSSSSNVSSNSSQSSRGETANVPRPPSYISDDGVDYVVEAQPRSIAPTGDVPLRSSMHPSELGRAGQPNGW